jgi:hypothetical protein
MVVTKRKTVFSLNLTDLVLGTSTAIFLLCGFDWAVDYSGRDVVYPLPRLSLGLLALYHGELSCSWWVLVTNFDPGTSIE